MHTRECEWHVLCHLENDDKSFQLYFPMNFPSITVKRCLVQLGL